MGKYVVMKWQKKAHRLYEKGFRIIPRLIYLKMRIICGCSIPPTVEIGEDTKLAHNGLGVIIHDKCRIGKGCTIQANVVLGGKNGEIGPTIGDYCYIGAGACVLGNIHVGDDSMIGANAVVLKDVPSATVVVGVPAKTIKNVDANLIGQQKQ